MVISSPVDERSLAWDLLKNILPIDPNNQDDSEFATSSDQVMTIAEEKLKSIYCSECRDEHSAKDMKLKVKLGFSNSTRKACREVSTTAGES